MRFFFPSYEISPWRYFFPVPVLILHLRNNTISSSIGIGTFLLTLSTCNGLKYLSQCFHWLANCAALPKEFVNRTWSLVGFSFRINLFVRHWHHEKRREISRNYSCENIDRRILLGFLNTYSFEKKFLMNGLNNL